MVIKMRYVMGVDIGTTAIKTAIFDENGILQADMTQEYTLDTPSNVMVELSADKYKEAFGASVRGAVRKSGIPAEEIISLGISAQGETFFCVGSNGEVLRPGIVWMDNRAQEESDEIEKVFGNKLIHRVTGQVSMCAAWPAAKILWIKKNQPDIFKRTNKYLLIEDYFIYLLTGKYVSEDSLLCSTILWNINTREYWKEMLDYLEISEEQLPEICCPGSLAGNITEKAARWLGLPEGMKVALGALDQACGAVGVGNIKRGIFSESTGAALATVAVTDRVVIDPSGEMPCFASAIPGKYMIHSFSTGGMAIRWFRDAFCLAELEKERRGGINAYTEIDYMVDQVGPGSDGLRMLPHLQGSGAPDTDSTAKGVFYGMTLIHKKPHFARAIMEGVTMVLMRMAESTQALGVNITELRSMGGGAKSAVWCQIKADALGVPVKIMKNTESAACLGAAILAGAAAGIWDSVEDAAERFAQYDKEYIPDKGKKGVYDRLLADYKKLLLNLKELFHTIS